VTTTTYVGRLSRTLMDASAGQHPSGPPVTAAPESLHTEEHNLSKINNHLPPAGLRSRMAPGPGSNRRAVATTPNMRPSSPPQCSDRAHFPWSARYQYSTEYRSPEAGAQVRILPGAPSLSSGCPTGYRSRPAAGPRNAHLTKVDRSPGLHRQRATSTHQLGKPFLELR
jgi:hypothetical protein